MAGLGEILTVILVALAFGTMIFGWSGSLNSIAKLVKTVLVFAFSAVVSVLVFGTKLIFVLAVIGIILMIWLVWRMLRKCL